VPAGKVRFFWRRSTCNGTSTLRQRVGNRYWKEPAPASAEVFCKDASKNFKCLVTDEQAQYFADGSDRATIEERAIWARIEGAHSHIEPAITTSGTDHDTDIWRLQAGFDGLLQETEDGSKLIGGITVHFGQASSEVTSIFGHGDIDTDGYGFGGTLTWYDKNGFYVDGQASLTWFAGDLTSKALGLATPSLVEGNGGFGYALSVETGKKIDLSEAWTVTPHAYSWQARHPLCRRPFKRCNLSRHSRGFGCRQAAQFRLARRRTR
jgi:outer membrane autotransporter protein